MDNTEHPRSRQPGEVAGELAIVVICSGNRFRSPLAEHLLRQAAKGVPVLVSSAGTLDLPPGPALPEAVELGRTLGVDLTQHRSRPLARELVADADLVLGFEMRHVKSAVVDGGADRLRTFMLGEFAALLQVVEPPVERDPVEAARAMIAGAGRLRPRVRRGPSELETPDPFGASVETYRATAAAIDALTTRIAAGLFRARRLSARM